MQVLFQVNHSFIYILIISIGLLQQTITWYKIRHAGGQAHHYSRTGTLKQRPVKLDWLRHREHTILLSRERVTRVNKGTKRMYSSPVVINVVISFILRDFTWKTAAYKSCVTLWR